MYERSENFINISLIQRHILFLGEMEQRHHTLNMLRSIAETNVVLNNNSQHKINSFMINVGHLAVSNINSIVIFNSETHKNMHFPSSPKTVHLI